MCNDIVKILPERILPVFSKGRHMDLKEALVKLKEKLGKILHDMILLSFFLKSKFIKFQGETYYENTAMNNVLQQEVDRFNRLLDIILKSISVLVKAIKGEIMISKSSESIFNSFLSQKVPSNWASNSYPSLKPLASWLKNLLQRTKYFSLWCRNLILFAENLFATMNPSSLWISGFFYPQGEFSIIL